MVCMKQLEQKLNDKKVAEISEKEILYQQLKLLAEESKECPIEELPQLTIAMCEIYKLLK